MKLKKIRHIRFPITMYLRDRFEILEEPVLRDFVNKGWGHWKIDYDNPNQLELFDEESN